MKPILTLQIHRLLLTGGCSRTSAVKQKPFAKAFLLCSWLVAVLSSGVNAQLSPADSIRNLNFFQTIRSGDAGRLDKILKEGANANATLEGYSALMAAALNGTVDEMKLLLSHGADVHYRNGDSITALWLAVPDEEKTKLLLAHGAKADARSREGNTVLVKLSFMPGNAGLMQTLIDKGCDPRNSCAQNDLVYNAAMSGDTAMLGLLLRYGASVNDSSTIGDYPVNGATSFRTFNTLKMLVDHGANVNVSTRHAILPLMVGITPLMWAAVNNDKASFNYLLQHGADASAKSMRGYTPLMFLAMAGVDDPEMTEALIRHGADPLYKAPDVTDALFYARLKGNTKSVAILTNYSNKKQ